MGFEPRTSYLITNRPIRKSELPAIRNQVPVSPALATCMLSGFLCGREQRPVLPVWRNLCTNDSNKERFFYV
ncbi:hypothetical protein PoB_007451400 [Plakobranchus ocellatus]|uniref:Uncharacterized protein n=1 Tax=Plakobranchus ocellatus TaxID=259542 RepID=A0AAV4DUT4_9GAST|nr:hypothetical protein PoB_007451400 [Plakobranchus ocellatus]